MKPKGILFQPREITCQIEGAHSVLEVALSHDIEISHSCGGMGSCTTCRIFIEHSDQPLPPRNELEQDIADMRNFDDRERLACQLPPLDGLVVRIPEVLADESST